MFASTAFPRIPLFSGEPAAEKMVGGTPAAEKSTTDKPPVVPFDALVQAASAAPRHMETHRRNAASVARYEDVVTCLKSDDSREFLAALVFLGTRSTVPGKTPVAKED